MHKFKILSGNRYVGHVLAENYYFALKQAREAYGIWDIRAQYIVPGCD
jgi:hypothetical protein